MARRNARNIASSEGVDFLARRFAEWGVRNLPSEWVTAAAKKLPKRLRESDDIQEEVARGLGIVAALGFGLDQSSQNAFSGMVEEAFEEIGKQAELHSEGKERKSYVRLRMQKLREDIEKKLSQGQTGKSIIDAIAEDLSEEDQERWHAMFYTFPPARHTEFLVEMEKRRGTAARIRLVLSTPALERYEAFLVMLEQASLLKEEKPGFLDQALSTIGGSVADFGPDGKLTKEFIKDLKESTAKMRREQRERRKLGL